MLSTPTSPASAGHKTANSAFPVTSSASSTTTTTSIQPSSLSSSSASNSLPDSNPLATNGSHLGAGAIAGIVVGIVIGAGIAAALILFHRRRKPENVQAEVKASSSADFQSPVPTRFVGEKDGSPIGPNELSGDGQLLEMATDNH